jgi:hypothetical protein
MALVPLRVLLVPRLPFTPEELAVLDGPTASPFASLPITNYMLHTDHHIDHGFSWRCSMIERD